MPKAEKRNSTIPVASLPTALEVGKHLFALRDALSAHDMRRLAAKQGAGYEHAESDYNETYHTINAMSDFMLQFQAKTLADAAALASEGFDVADTLASSDIFESDRSSIERDISNLRNVLARLTVVLTDSAHIPLSEICRCPDYVARHAGITGLSA
jgi:hypothetical protein